MSTIEDSAEDLKESLTTPSDMHSTAEDKDDVGSTVSNASHTDRADTTGSNYEEATANGQPDEAAENLKNAGPDSDPKQSLPITNDNEEPMQEEDDDEDEDAQVDEVNTPKSTEAAVEMSTDNADKKVNGHDDVDQPSKPTDVAEEVAESGTTMANGSAENDNELTSSPMDEVSLRKCFEMFDLDNSGHISADEFGTMVRSLGQNPTDEELDELLKSIDRDQNGSLNFSEFKQLMGARVESRKDINEEDVFRQAFKVFDKDNSGKLSRQELRNIVTSYGQMKLTDEDADELLESADFDGDGLIDYEEFVKLFTSTIEL